MLRGREQAGTKHQIWDTKKQLNLLKEDTATSSHAQQKTAAAGFNSNAIAIVQPALLHMLHMVSIGNARVYSLQCGIALLRSSVQILCTSRNRPRHTIYMAFSRFFGAKSQFYFTSYMRVQLSTVVDCWYKKGTNNNNQQSHSKHTHASQAKATHHIHAYHVPGTGWEFSSTVQDT